MSTANQIVRACAAAGVVINPSGNAAGVDDRATRLAAA
jgi:predicted Rossmann fold nucleotide-binding protein DprA/Smf involved in DNA uptake